MKRFLAILITTLTLSFALNAQEHTRRPPATTPPARPTPTPVPVDNGGWVRYNSVTGRFSVLMPSTPEEKTDTTQSDHGPYTTHLFVVRDDANVFLIGWVDYDPSFNFNRQAELEANRDNFVKGVNATLTSTHTMSIDGYSVLEFTADAGDRTFKSRVYMVGRRPYQIVIGYPKGNDELAPIARFFNSFKVSPS
ncbi:MAG TPA: hypothetical protein VJ749_14580 [Pyrinomonadaceae bacterium]|jgi:hypothetical protein|nr:hypothetical protein [Pyrinomonadaceae bacterium]